jgi:pilus assembly protein Flp/PilA
VIGMIAPNSEKGQGLVEYALIIVFVAIIVIAALVLLGPIVRDTYIEINSAVEGTTYILQII